MKKSLLMVSLLLFGLATSPSYGYKVYNTVTDTSCATWLQEVNTSDSVQYHQMTSWVNGFVSGVGAAGINLTETDVGSLHGFVTQHCQCQPGSTVVQAVEQLTGTLEKIKSRSDCHLPFLAQ